jgi:hypothetical protein
MNGTRNMNTRYCRICKKNKPTTEFYLFTRRRKNKDKTRIKITQLIKTECKKCTSELSKKYNRSAPGSMSYIYYRHNDKKRGYRNDLSRDDIGLLFSQPCFYCGRKVDKMVLDRIDNNKGHTKDNVNQSCVICNTIRMDLPYEAWVLLVPDVKEVVNSGVLDNWIWVK